jgi:hypothetical protein
MIHKKLLLIAILISAVYSVLTGQNLYTARGYWQESTKQSYIIIKEKKEKGQALTADEAWDLP